MELVLMVYADPRRSLGIISSLFSGYTISFFRDVYLENSGEVLPKFCLGSV